MTFSVNTNSRKIKWNQYTYDVQGYTALTGYFNLVAGFDGGTGNIENVVTDNMSYDIWRDLSLRLIPYNANYPKNSTASNEAISTDTAAFYRLACRDRGRTPDIDAQIGYNNGHSGINGIATPGTMNWVRTWSNTNLVFDIAPDTDATVLWTDDSSASGNATPSVVFKMTEHHRVQTTGTMYRYPFVAWKCSFQLLHTVSSGTATSINAGRPTYLHVGLYGVNYVDSSLSTTSFLTIDTRTLLDSAVATFVNDGVSSTDDDSPFAHMRQLNSVDSYDAIELRMAVSSSETDSEAGFTSLYDPTNTDFFRPQDMLQLYIESWDLISSSAAVEMLSNPNV